MKKRKHKSLKAALKDLEVANEKVQALENEVSMNAIQATFYYLSPGTLQEVIKVLRSSYNEPDYLQKLYDGLSPEQQNEFREAFNRMKIDVEQGKIKIS